jgi:flavin reductase (DIM6/NTAB) family NADH-FMN oxidoreductase RutF
VKVEISPWRAARLISPGPVVLVTARYRDRTNIMPAAWVTPLSQFPPLIGVAIHPARFTHDLIRRSGQFALNVPGRPLAETVHKCGNVSANDGVDKWSLGPFTMAEPKQIEAPLIEECLAWIECGVVESFETGDHTLFVGEVLVVQVEKEAFDEAWLLPDEELKPVHFLGGHRYAVLDRVIELGGGPPMGEVS